MRVLVACEFSGKVREAFRRKGHDAWSCDVLPTYFDREHHYQCDVLDILDKDWDLMVAHPPCTYLSNLGTIHLHSHNSDKYKSSKSVCGEARWKELRKAAAFFRKLLLAPIKHIAIENPVPSGHAAKRMGLKYNQIVQPWHFGHNNTKRTCLWLKNLPKLEPTKIVVPISTFRDRHYGPDKIRQKLRSVTYQGIANAMAQQWSIL